ncbi:MAG: hypothetical protein Q9224_000574 [Gallowayella concinna]
MLNLLIGKEDRYGKPGAVLDAHGEDRNHRTVLQLYTNDEGTLRLETTPALRNGEQEIIDTVAQLVHTHNQNHLGKTYLNCFSNRTETFLDNQFDESHVSRKAVDGSIQEHKLTVVLPVRKKRCHSRVSASSLERCKPSVTDLPALSADIAEDSVPGTRINTPNTDSEDLHCSESSDDDDDRDFVLETDQFETLTANDVKGLTQYYHRGFGQVGTVMLKPILRAWIAIKVPKKQTSNPYNGRKSKEEQALYKERTGKAEVNPGRHTAPDWWPKQDGHERGRGCRHKGPDHMKKQERTILVLRMIRLTSSQVGGVQPKNIKEPLRPFSIANMRASTDQIAMAPDQRRMLEQIYQVREKEQLFEEGGIGTCIVDVVEFTDDR